MTNADKLSEWAVTVRLTAPGVPLDEIVAALDGLWPAAPAGSLTAGGVTLRFTVSADAPGDAVAAGLAELREVVSGTALAGAPVSSVGAARETAEAGAAEQAPWLAGVEETAELLELSATQVRDLLGSSHFPQPVAWLRQGPVWLRPHVERYRERLHALSD